MIETTLSKQQAEALFAEHAVMMYGHDAVFDYKIAELFGQECCAWAESCMKFEGALKGGRDYNSSTGHINYFYREGFHKLVSWHNERVSLEERKACTGGKVWDELWAARSAYLAALDAEDERKAAERKAKRAAARKAKLEAQRAAEGGAA